MKKFTMYAVFCTAAAVIVLFALWTQKPENNSPEKNISRSVSERNDTASENAKAAARPKEDTEENIPAGTNILHIKKYILKYVNGDVVLICRDENGNTTKRKVDGINVDYLTDTDKEYLEKGIELDTAEQVYKLIEDYTS